MPVTIHVDGNEVIFRTPGEARAASRRYKRMARDLVGGADETPEVTMKVHELRARAKQLDDWARLEEDRAPAEPDHAPAEEQPPAEPSASSPRRAAAAAALRQTGIRVRKQTRGQSGRTRRAVRRYEQAGGVPSSSIGEFVLFFAGSVVALVLLEDVLTPKGSAGFAKVTTVGTQIVHRIIAPVPIVNAPGG